MNNCLVTKLKGVVNDDSLLKVGEIRFKIVGTKGDKYIISSVDQVISIVNGGTFTDGSTSKKMVAGISCSVSASLGSIISVPNKYALLKIVFDGIVLDSYQINDLLYCSTLSELNFYNSDNLDELSLIKGKMSDFKNMDVLNSFVILYFNVTGNLLDLNTNCYSLIKTLKLPLGVVASTADVALFKNINIFDIKSISGEIANLNVLKSLNAFNLYDGLYGSLSGFKDLPLLSINAPSYAGAGITFTIEGLPLTMKMFALSSKFTGTGDLALAPSNLQWLGDKLDKNSTFTWSNRDSTSSIICGAAFNITGTSVDDVLINQAKCKDWGIASAEFWKRRFVIYGTRTSASDAAVATLTALGLTVVLVN